jgi:hypothetical protein
LRDKKVFVGSSYLASYRYIYDANGAIIISLLAPLKWQRARERENEIDGWIERGMAALHGSLNQL